MRTSVNRPLHRLERWEIPLIVITLAEFVMSILGLPVIQYKFGEQGFILGWATTATVVITSLIICALSQEHKKAPAKR